MPQIVRDLIVCLRSWEPEVRILGNVQAGPAADALESMRSVIEAAKEHTMDHENCGCGLCAALNRHILQHPN